MPRIDLRSDTVTRPTPAMRAAMAAAEVGDDVFGDDPTVRRLEERLAAMVGKEAAIFVPSGTMSNQIAVRLHCQPGDEILCEAGCHIYNYEQGGAAQLSGVSVRPIAAQEGLSDRTCAERMPQEQGILRLADLEGLIRPDNEHLVRTRLVALENTHNRGGGRILPYDEVERICSWAHEKGLLTHLDGARLFNAVVAGGIAATKWCQHFDTVSICFSKGLGAPVGSALAGTRRHIAQARRHRKLFGGGMRQVGILAAGALHALEHHVERLAEDHAHAQLLAQAIRETPGLELRPRQVDTNLVIFHVDPALGTAVEFVKQLEERGLGVVAFGPTLIRACTHLDASRADIEAAAQILRETATACRNGARPRAAVLDTAY